LGEEKVGKMKDIELPDIGDFHDVEVIEILVAVGDTVAVEDSLMTLESDKATMEIPSPSAGVVNEVRIAIGDKINKGDVIFVIDSADAVEESVVPDEVVEEPTVQAEAAPVEPAPAAATQSSVTERMIDIVIPDIGDFKDVEVVEVIAQVGDEVAKEASLVTLETEKATMEIPSVFAGKITALTVKVGDHVNQGDVIGQMKASVAEATAEPEVGQAPTPEVATVVADEVDDRAHGEKETQRRPVIAKPSDAPAGKAHASPAVRRFARELGVDLYHVPGSGQKGRISKEDVQAFVKRTLREGAPQVTSSGGFSLPAQPTVDFSKFGEIEQKPLGRIKKISGKHLHNAWLGIPHVTQFDEADITELEDFRKSQKAAAETAGVKVTFMPFLMKALAMALREYPQFNASLAPDLESLIYKKYLHIGVAVDTPDGLMVPVIKDVDKKGVFELAADLMDVSQRARDGKLSPSDLSGGCISISSLGGIGGTQFTPIVNSPEVAILGVSKAEMQPKWNGSDFVPRLMMPFSLSYDHRVIDGAEGVRFTQRLSSLLSDIRRLVL
jgi:pyruvate dehydrogenase E2 component (dihydrolipoamide acetyltransferase)